MTLLTLLLLINSWLLYKLNIIQRPEYKKCLADDVLFRDEFPDTAVIAVSAVVAHHEVILLAQLYWLGCAPCAGREIGIINIVEYFDIFKGRIYMGAAKTNPARIKWTHVRQFPVIIVEDKGFFLIYRK